VLRHGVVDQLTRLTLVLIGFVYFWSRLQLDPVPRGFPHLVSVWITFTEVIFDAALGLTLWFSGHIVAADYYQALGRTFGALMNRMVREDDRQAREIDRQLDEQDEESTGKPWWESDPVLSERFRKR
jgi:Cytochrome c oxidase caa3 assembly factor (Caa3_CtaG)